VYCYCLNKPFVVQIHLVFSECFEWFLKCAVENQEIVHGYNNEKLPNWDLLEDYRNKNDNESPQNED